ncbi:hypothetical protein CU098_008073, partial [Rhizopus stolonifer]
SFGVYTDNRQLVRDEAGEAVLSTAEDTQSRIRILKRRRIEQIYDDRVDVISNGATTRAPEGIHTLKEMNGNN